MDLTGQTRLSLAVSAPWVDTEIGGDFFYVSGRTDAAIDRHDVLRAWWGPGGINDLIDISQFDDGPLYLRLGLFSDATVDERRRVCRQRPDQLRQHRPTAVGVRRSSPI